MTNSATSGDFHANLKEATKDAHASLEKQLVLRIKNIRTPDDYVSLLKMMYGYYHGIEPLLEPYQAKFNDHEKRRKSAFLLDDIRKYEPAATVDRVCTGLPAIGSYHAALGAMYVLEGSTLGGQIIAAMLAKQMGMEDGASFAFFNCYGGRTKEMWDSFKQHLQEDHTPREQELITRAAMDTFDTFKAWAQANEK